MRLLKSFLPLRNIETSDLNLRNPWKIARTQRRHSNDSMGIQNLKIPRGRKRAEHKLSLASPMSGGLGAVTCRQKEKESDQILLKKLLVGG
jgi:hypothetical protein